jgi:L-alanine-DL-glutamate epimerase-like enolase superfamily enzyme
MRIADIGTVLLGYRKSDPPMQRGFALVRVETSAGTIGYGEASTNWGYAYPTVVETVIRDVVAPNLVGRDARNIRERVAELHVLLDGYLGWEGVTSQVIGAVEIALWDVLGQEVELPVAQLLGGGRAAIKVYGTGTTMFDEPPEWHARYFTPALQKGVGAVKVRFGKSLEADIELVRTVREQTGPRIRIMGDAYWGYPPDQALKLAQRIDQYDVYFFEEPSPQYDLAGLRWLCERSPIRIAVGERVYSPSQFRAIAEAAAARVFEPDASVCGGILACLEVATIAKGYGIEIIPHVGGPTPVGMAANLHWAAAAGCELIEYDVDPYQPVRDELEKDGLLSFASIENGIITVPDRPGLGISIDESAFDRFPYVSGETYAEVFPQHETGRLAE